MEDVGHMEENLKEMGRELSSIRDREKNDEILVRGREDMTKEATIGKGRPIGNYGKFIHGEIQCRMPKKSYALYLKEQWLQFQIKTLAQRGTMPFQHYKKFIDLYDQSTMEDRVKISKFYLHNLAVINLNVWDPNPKIGDLQLFALASWMSDEEARTI